MSVEVRYDESLVAGLAAREKQMQQNYRPVISVHKWFARRPGSLFRGLALAELVDEPLTESFSAGHQLRGICLDPFMGGGSPIFESARLGLSVIGYDTNPMARWVVERELEDVDPDELRATGELVCADVQQTVDHLYRTDCPDCGADAHARYFLWLRHHHCECGSEHPLLADTKVVSAAMGRHPHDVHCCPHCLTLTERDPGRPAVRCGHCRRPFATGLIAPDSTHHCADCSRPYRVPPRGTIETPSTKLIGVDYHCAACAVKPGASKHTYKTADARDHQLVGAADWLAATTPAALWPGALIPSGVETERLLRWGYNQWTDLFNPRQMHGLGVLAERICAEPDGQVKRALQTCFSDGLRFQNMLCRYDRQALKPTDVFAVHGFPVPRVSCEPHLLGVRGTGSGGFRHMLAKYERAKRWCREPYETLHDGTRLTRIHTAPEKLAPKLMSTPQGLAMSGSALLRCASLTVGDLPAESVDLVLTDPPYYANVQYAELMDLCYAWLRQLAPTTAYFTTASTKTDNDAVGADTATGVDIVEFTRRLSEVYVAAAHALRPGGAFVFTYHHNDADAYTPLVVACADAGLTPTRLYACPSEMRASTHIHGRNAATIDTVFVLRKPPLPVPAATFMNPDGFVSARVAALQRAGLQPADADRACLRHAHAAARALLDLVTGWDGERPVADRVSSAREALFGRAQHALGV